MRNAQREQSMFSWSRPIIILLAVTLAAAGALALGANSALAAGTWNVTNNNSDGSFSGGLDRSAAVTLTDSATGAELLTCTGSSITGTAPSGTDLSARSQLSGASP